MNKDREIRQELARTFVRGEVTLDDTQRIAAEHSVPVADVENAAVDQMVILADDVDPAAPTDEEKAELLTGSIFSVISSSSEDNPENYTVVTTLAKLRRERSIMIRWIHELRTAK